MIKFGFTAEPAIPAHYLSSEAKRHTVSGGMNGALDRKIEQTIVYMSQHLDQPLQAAKLAALANVSLSHYFALFKKWTGSAPIDFFIRLRMRRACHLLETTSLKVKEIAAALGYDDPFYFSRVFKSVNGMAPIDYRNRRRNPSEHLNTDGQSSPLSADADRPPGDGSAERFSPGTQDLLEPAQPAFFHAAP